MYSSSYSSSQKADVSVIVCHHQGELLYDFLESLQKTENVYFETIVMTSNEEIATEGIKGCLTFHHTGMPAAKRNAGARIARGKYLAFFDDDVTIDPLCLYHLKDGIKDDVAMTYGKLWNMEHTDRFDEAGGYLTATGFIWSRAGQNDKDVGQYNQEELILAGKSASCMVRADIFKKVGGFDEDFGILGEETDLSWRIWLNGKQVKFTPQATGLHAFNTKFKPKEKHYTNERVFYNGSRNYVTMLFKCLGKEHLWILLIHIPIWFFVGLIMILTGKWSQGWNIWKGLGYCVKNGNRLIEKRRKVQNARKIADRDIWPHIFRKTSGAYYRTRILRYLTLGLHG